MSDIPEEELKQLGSVFKELKVKPKMDSPEDFKRWMKDYVKQMEDTSEVKVKDEPATSSTSGVTTTSQYRPKLSYFYGDGCKQDIPYDQWRYEVDCLVREKYQNAIIAQSIRNSLKGNAAQVAMRLGPDASVTALLEKMESIFGSIERGETIMQQFYSSSQGQTEDSMTWSCRLEEIYRKAVKKGVASKDDQNSKLRTRYWNGLHQWLRDITAYKYDAIKDFDELRREIRLIEKEHDVVKVQTNMAAASEATKSDELSEIKGMIQQLTTKVNSMEKKQESFGSTAYRRGTYNRTDTPRFQRGRGYGQGRGNQQLYSSQSRYQRDYGNPLQPTQTNDGEPICFRCRQPGHLARGCRVILDHSRRGLNSNRPSSRGRR